MIKSAKEEKLRFDLDEERKKLMTETEKDQHFIDNIRNVIWHGESQKRSDKLITDGRLKYVHIPGVCGYVDAA